MAPSLKMFRAPNSSCAPSFILLWNSQKTAPSCKHFTTFTTKLISPRKLASRQHCYIHHSGISGITKQIWIDICEDIFIVTFDLWFFFLIHEITNITTKLYCCEPSSLVTVLIYFHAFVYSFRFGLCPNSNRCHHPDCFPTLLTHRSILKFLCHISERIAPRNCKGRKSVCRYEQSEIRYTNIATHCNWQWLTNEDKTICGCTAKKTKDKEQQSKSRCL